ncbi:MAG TPA: GxxExxY protein [Candidatus Cloacimonadota bacterium]|nr:GxxExxY protein [Candidatus Cloacimonadota bacterium]HOD53358.1 GxxExxY protein [Candidatus Cloacimonadota bacterium]HPM02987.1 GxxExxY protein [Candidatus Cloacimonadota bacterium]
MEIDEITGIVIDTALNLHIKLGPGLLESVYEVILAKQLELKGLKIERQKCINFEFEGVHFQEGFRCDLLVESKIIVELKSVESLNPVSKKQLLTYLRLMNLEVGLLINFGAEKLKDGLHRIVNHHVPSTNSKLNINQQKNPL